MFLSIIVPVYNVKDYLIRCLDSICTQKFEDYECIIVDDGSTDGSEVIVDKYCMGKEKFKVYHKENGGLMSAWVYGVKKASGRYLGFVDSDDYIASDMYEIMCKKAAETNADIVMCDRFDVCNGVITEPSYNEKSISEGLYSEVDMDFIKSMVFPLDGVPELTKARWNKIFERNLYMDNLKYCACLSKTFEDRYITPPCVFSAKKFYYVKKPLYYYEHRSGSNSGMYKPDLLDQIKRLYYVERDVLVDKNIFDVYQENWEYLFMDYIRQYVSRNIKHVKKFSLRYQSAKQMLSDNIVKERLAKYGKFDNTKLGKIVYISYKTNAPLLLTLASYL